MKPHSSTSHDKAFNSLDVQKAAAFGWESHRGLTQNESQVINFMATRGTRSEPGYAFSWFPIGGQDWWAAMMAMPHSSLRKTLMSLRKKGLIRNLAGSTKDSRFTNLRGYGIPEAVLSECREWWQSRQDMVYARVPDTVEQVFVDVPNSEQICSDPGTSLFRSGTFTSLESLTPGQVSALYQCNNQGETNLLTESARPSGARCTSSQEPSMRYADEWEVPRDERERPRRKSDPDRWDAPKEFTRKKASPSRPAGRLADLFDQEWMKSREKHLMLSNKWNSKVAFCTRLNDLLKDYSEDEVAEMIRTFFLLIGGNKITLRSDELWKDFWNNRSACTTHMRDRTPTVTVVIDDAAELEKLERLNAKSR